MGRKKKIETVPIASDEKFGYRDGELVYCEYRKCPHMDCIRHNANTPFNLPIWRRKIAADKDWNCNGYLTLEMEQNNV